MTRDPDDPAIPTRAEAERDAYYDSLKPPVVVVHDDTCDDPWCVQHGTPDLTDTPPF